MIAVELFDSIIVRNEILISDMPHFQLTQLFGSDDSDIQDYFQQIKNKFIDAITKELGNIIKIFNVPSKEDILSRTKFEPLNWNPIISFKKSHKQSKASFSEQKRAIELCKDAIDKYTNINNQLSLTKNIGI